jgi:hypothetical protein
VALLPSDNFKVPFPDLRSYRLSDGSQHSEVLQRPLDVLIPSTLEQPQRGRGDVKLGHFVFRNDVPVPREVGIGRGPLEHNRGDAEEERSVDDIRVAGNPPHVASAEEPVAVVDIKHVLARHGGPEEVPGRGVHDPLGLPRGAGGVEQEEGVLRVHGLRGDVRRPLLDLLVPPPVAALGHGHVGAGAAVHQAVGDVRALLQRIVDNLLGADQLAAALALVAGDDDLGPRIVDPIAQGVGGEAGEDDGVDGTDARAGQEGDERLGDHGQVDGNGVALLDAHLLEHVGCLADLAQQLAVGQGAALADLVGLVDDGGLLGVVGGMAIDAVVGGVQLTLEEPGVVAVGEAAGVDGLEVAAPGEELSGLSAPELLGFGNGLFVEGLVLLEACSGGGRG